MPDAPLIDVIFTVCGHAAHALSIDAVLATSNTREFSHVGGLRLENWVDQAEP